MENVLYELGKRNKGEENILAHNMKGPYLMKLYLRHNGECIQFVHIHSFT